MAHGNFESLVVLVRLHALNRLDLYRKGSVSLGNLKNTEEDRTALAMLVKLQNAQFLEGRSCKDNRQGEYSKSKLVPRGESAHVDKLQLSVLAKVLAKALLAERLDVLYVANLERM